jgi:hypothetical protein
MIFARSTSRWLDLGQLAIKVSFSLSAGRPAAGRLPHYNLNRTGTILLNQVGKDLREIQELLRHKNIRTSVRYTHVGYEQTRQTAEALTDALEWKRCGGDDSSRAQ